MPGEPKAAQKRPRLPFKPPSRTSNAEPSVVEPSVALKANRKTKQTTNASASTSAPKSASKPVKSKPSTKPIKPATATKKRSHVESPSPGDSQSGPARPATGKKARVEPSAADDSQSGSESDSGASARDRSRSLSQEPDYILAEITTTNPPEDVTYSEPTIPPKLLTRLLHQHFQNDKTKVAKDANNVVAKYVDVFVREAIARAAYERAETNEHAGGRTVGDGFLEVEDLEKMAPQLTMDF